MKFNFCPNCGFKLEERFNYCPGCGICIRGEEKVYTKYETTPYEEKQDIKLSEEKPDTNYDNITKNIYIEDYYTDDRLVQAKKYFNDEDYPTALSYLIDYATIDDSEIQYMIGYCLYMTKKFDPNCEKFLKLAADKNHPIAQAVIGELYYSLAENTNQELENAVTKEQYEQIRDKCESYYSLAIKYLNLAKDNGIK